MVLTIFVKDMTSKLERALDQAIAFDALDCFSDHRSKSEVIRAIDAWLRFCRRPDVLEISVPARR